MTREVVEWGLAARPAAGETDGGDAALVNQQGRRALVAAVDALGHGPAAAYAAREALAALGDEETDVTHAAELCHRALKGTRGAALTLVSFDADSELMTWLGVGNVEGRLLRAGAPAGEPDSLLLRPGIAGEYLPSHPPTATHVQRGDVLVLATDGVAPSFSDDVRSYGSCEEIAASLLERHAMTSDDALVLVVRYFGGKR
jgi:phosphoserine phosphatase RsbX